MKNITKFYLSQILNKKIYDEYNQFVGILKDIYVTTEDGYPKVIAYKVKKDRDISNYEFMDVKFIKIKSNIVINAVDVRDIIPRRYSYLLSRDLLGKKIVDINNKKVIKVDDLSLIQTSKGIRIVALNSGLLYCANRFRLGNVAKLFSRFLDENIYNNVVIWGNIKSLKMIDNNLKVSVSCEKILKFHPNNIADIFKQLDASDKRRLFNGLNMNLNTVNCSEQTIKNIMNTNFKSFNLNTTVEETIDFLKKANYDDEIIFNIFVIDNQNKLRGIIPISELIKCNKNDKLLDVMKNVSVLIYDYDNISKVVSYALEYDMVSIPVVDKKECICGIVVIDDILNKIIPQQLIKNFKYVV